jgi:hypothetical protein
MLPPGLILNVLVTMCASPTVEGQLDAPGGCADGELDPDAPDGSPSVGPSLLV